MGVIGSDAVAPGTPYLTRPDMERFDEVFGQVREMSAKRIRAPWVTVVPEREALQGGRRSA